MSDRVKGFTEAPSLCACGCGESPLLPESRFVRNHDRRGVPRTPEQRARISAGLNARFARNGRRDPLDAFLAKRRDDPESGCWIPHTKSDGKGYTLLHRAGKSFLLHRLSYQRFVGVIPEGYEIDHLCRNPRCFNPDHLEAVTGEENNRRSNSISARNAAKTHCLFGHPFSGDNLAWLTHKGRKVRVCVTCRRRRHREDYARSRRNVFASVNVEELRKEHFDAMLKAREVFDAR